MTLVNKDMNETLEIITNKIMECVESETDICIHTNICETKTSNAIIPDKCEITEEGVYFEAGWYQVTINSHLNGVEYIETDTSPMIEIYLYFDNGAEIYITIDND